MTAVEISEERAETLTEELIEQTGRDPALGPRERETTLRFATDEDAAHVHTEEPALIRRCLAHDHLDVDELRVITDDEVRRLTFDDVVANGGVDGRVAALRGRVPVACLTVKADPRKNDQHAAAVSEAVFDE
jgi:hypothetical protein